MSARCGLEDGRTYAASRVVLAAGVQPNKLLAERSGLACARGIIVDRQLATAQPGVSAIGECCEIDGQTWGWWLRVCVRLKCWLTVCAVTPGEDFHWQDSGTRLKVTGIDLFSAGDLRADEQDEICTSWIRWTVTTVVCCCATAACAASCCWAIALKPRRSPLLAGGACICAGRGFLDPSSTMQPRAAGQTIMTKPVLVLVGHGMVGHPFS